MESSGQSANVLTFYYHSTYHWNHSTRHEYLTVHFSLSLCTFSIAISFSLFSHLQKQLHDWFLISSSSSIAIENILSPICFLSMLSIKCIQTLVVSLMSFTFQNTKTYIFVLKIIRNQNANSFFKDASLRYASCSIASLPDNNSDDDDDKQYRD